jgi:NTP pyrophosphatase (non-canonical NTP hydrolase)
MTSEDQKQAEAIAHHFHDPVQMATHADGMNINMKTLLTEVALKAIESVREHELSFEHLEAANAERVTVFGHEIQDWSPTDWACAMAGEAGEACNFIKKLRRGDFVDMGDIARELADVVIYADLLAQRLDLKLGGAVRLKFNEVSEKKGSAVFI